jgi:hypothetical protein
MKHFTTKVLVTIVLAGAEIASTDMAKCNHSCERGYVIRQGSCIAFEDLPQPFVSVDVIPPRHPGGLFDHLPLAAQPVALRRP